MEIERKVPEKKIKVFPDENESKRVLLSSYSLVGLYVVKHDENLGLKLYVAGKNLRIKKMFGSWMSP